MMSIKQLFSLAFDDSQCREKILLTALIAWFAAASAVAAPPPEMVVKRMDRDGDGKISSDEWIKPAQLFQRMDLDGDGYLTREEIAASRERRNVGGSGGGQLGGPGPMIPSAAPKQGAVEEGWIDVHFHLVANKGDIAGFVSAADKAISVMDRDRIAMALVMSPPRPKANFDVESLTGVKKKYGSRIALLGGGGTLNPMIHAVADASAISDELKAEFRRVAENIVSSGAKGFGEIAAHHVSLSQGHGYEWVAPDHPLLLLLADIAAKHDMPIDLHFDPIPKEVDTPGHLTSPNNPRVLKENLKAFDRFLTHNRQARIVWAHAGSDTVGWYTPELVRNTLEKHPNLYFSIRPVSAPNTEPVWNPKDGLNYSWIRVFEDYPDRFVLGTDSFVVSDAYTGKAKAPRIFEQRTQMQRDGVNELLSGLSKELARKIGYENAVRIYRLKASQ